MVAFRARGGKIVSMRVGNDYVIDIERMVFGKPHGLLITGAPYHEVWTLPEYESTCVPYFASVFRAPVRVMPHLWSPVGARARADGAMQATAFRLRAGTRTLARGDLRAQHLHGQDQLHSAAGLRVRRTGRIRD